MFAELERFVAAHRPCGGLTADVGEPIESGYGARPACACGAAFERWVAPSDADRDLLRSGLAACPN